MTRSLAVSGLTENQEAFCLEYAKSGNASASYRLAYPNTKAKPENVNVLASRLMAEVKVKSRIEALRNAAEQKTDMTIERWAQEVTRLATTDARNIAHSDGKIKMPHELDDDTAAAIASFKIDSDGKIEYRFWPKTQALDMMAKHKGAYEKDNAQKSGALDGMSVEAAKALIERLHALNEKTIDGEVVSVKRS